jgi:hypothetical protein
LCCICNQFRSLDRFACETAKGGSP